MGQCQACEKDQKINEAVTSNGDQQNASMTMRLQSKNHSLAGDINHSRKASATDILKQSQHQLLSSNKPTIQIEKIGNKEWYPSSNDYTDGSTSKFAVECHSPPSTFAESYNLSITSFWKLVSPKVTETIKDIGEYVYKNPRLETEGIYLGLFQIENGAIYDGQWKFGLRFGKGKQVWRDGSLYEGYWQNNQAHGLGRLIHNDGDIYEGEWLNDKANGEGFYIHNDGARYDGQWREDKQEGDGYETWPDGSSYRGNYNQNKKHGQGLFKWTDDSYYQGEFQNNFIQGKGYTNFHKFLSTYVWGDGRKYTGEWKQNQMHGYGNFSWIDGRIYSGQYLNDKKEGQGTFTWRNLLFLYIEADGSRYEGNWNKGKQHGQGKVIDEKGNEKQGIWLEGQIDKWLD